MSDERKNLASVGKKKISCLFLADHDRYNAGESAGFDAITANQLKKRGVVEFNDHEIKNDTGLMKLLSGENAGGFGAPGGKLSESDVSALIDKKLDEKLKPLFDLLEQKSEKTPEKPADKEPLKNAIRK